ncbi:MAG: hypothetical protein LBR68_03335, partial [Lachnoclostridium sp.]|nr:hypothetical protein [Lachnoclostridium sp.]
MVINSVVVNNFRCYYGSNPLSFNSNGKITLIYGDSGYGKSSLLQFFRWMFYGDVEFGKDNDKPLFNITAYEECKAGDTVEVSGQIDFEHLGVSYRLNKSQLWYVSFMMENSSSQQPDYQLQIMGDDGGYHPFTGNVANKINTILPKGLSKYFLLDGERSRDIVLDSNELKKAIHALFGLDAYTEAISHIGTTRNAKSTVLGHYATKMAASSTKVVGSKMSISDMTELAQDLYDEIDKLKTKRTNLSDSMAQKNARRDEILKTLGAGDSKSNLNELINATKRIVKENEDKIVALQHEIGNLFYKTYPYLFLAQITSQSSVVLRKKNFEYATNYRNTFQNLRKDLLEEILRKDTCVCERELDDASRKKIMDIIAKMPPGSHDYVFGQFVLKAKSKIRIAQEESMEYEKLINQIAMCEEDISSSEDIISEKIEELKRIDSAKDLVAELEQIKKDIERLDREKSIYDGKIAQKEQDYVRLDRELIKATKSSIISSQYKEQLDFFEQIVELLKDEKEKKETHIKDILNNCVREIFKKLTTQTELDADEIQFVNDDFSLRTTYLTGGQLAVDVYSYVIGIIKALQECNMDNNEN